MKVNRVGIVGCGGIAKAHRAAYTTLGISIAGVTDSNPAAAEAFQAETPSAETFSSLEALASSGKIDAISICTPPCFHEEAVRVALEHRIPVLCEKPLAHTLEAALAIGKLADATQVPVMIAFRHRFLPAIRKVKELSTKIGSPILFQNIFCGPAFDMGKKWFSKRDIAGGGALVDTSIHSVDLFRFLVGDVREVGAMMETHLEGLEVEDSAALSLRSTVGTLATIQCSWAVGKGAASIDLFGSKGRIRYDYSTPDKVFRMEGTDTKWQEIAVTPSSGFAEEIAHFIAAVEGREPLACSHVDGIRAQQIISKAYAGGGPLQ